MKKRTVPQLALAFALLISPAAAKDIKSVGIITGPLGNPFFISLAKGAEAGVKEINPNAEVSTSSYEFDLNRQFELIDSYVSAGKDMILMFSADPDAVTPAVKKAQKAGIVVVGMDSAANAADANVVTDNRIGGVLVCDYLAKQMGGKGDLVILNGPQATSVMARVEGCKESLAKYPAITIAADQQGDASRDQGFSIMQSLMTRLPEIDGVFAINDNMAIGAELAARQAGRSGVKIAGFDGSPDLVQALKTSKMIVGSASQDPYGLGMKAAQIGYDIMNGKPRPAQFVSQPSGLVHRENVDSYPGWRQ